ncbi:Npt1/Npt2 family nucleotide transporter [Flavobacteriaceae bacterium SZ-1-7]|uniref:Npt1/Npt2 family nucleotide transporter n=1 Tax=Tamlana sedimenti TaxID=3134126 RepID=UPI0031227DDA
MEVLKPIKLYILKIFDLKEDELKKTLLLQLNIFIIISVLLIIKPTVNSLFLSELSSDAIPLGYVLTALVAVFGSFFYNKGLEKNTINIIIDRTLMASILSLIIFAIVFKFDLASGYVLYIPYTWVAIFGLLTASQFWILANLAYNAREAKRVFGFIGAGAIAGAIFGGYLTSVLTTFLASEDLFFVAALLLVGCIPITRYIWENEVEKLNPFQISIRSNPSGKSSFKLIKQSRLLTLIAVVVGISVLVAKLVDYQYSDYASRIIQDQDNLTAFFGFWFSTLSVISLLIQLFLTKHLVGTFGVGKSLLWLPSGILIGSTLLLFVPELWVVVFIKIIDGSLKQSVNKAATELLSIPIPIDIKKKTKTFTDVVVDSIATGLAGFILIFFINGLNISSTYVSLIILGLIVVWLYFIYHLRLEYITAFKGLLEVSPVKSKNTEKKPIEITSIISSVIRVLKTGNENQILHMLNKTLENKDERFFYPIKDLLNHPSKNVRTLAIENLYFLKTENLSSRMEQMIYDEDQMVTTAAFKYLLKHTHQNSVTLFDRYLNDNDKTIKNAALIGLASELRNYEVLQNRFNLEQKISNALTEYEMLPEDDDKNFKIQAILEAIGKARVNSFYSILEKQLSSENTEVVNTAILSASQTLDIRFIKPIISFLSIKEHRKYAMEALNFYNEPVIKILYELIKNEDISIEDAIHTIDVIESFSSQKAINTLSKLTDETEHSIKIKAIEAIKRLKWKHPHLIVKDRFIVDKIVDECHLYESTLSVIHSQIVIKYKKKENSPNDVEENDARNALIALLELRLDRQLERMFSFLGIKYPPNDVEPIFNTIINGKEEQRIHAIEFLDNILDKDLKKDLIPVAESVLYDINSEERIKLLNLKILSEIECYHALLQRKDQKLKMAVIYLIEKTNNKKFIPLLEFVVQNDKNDKIRKRAEEILLKL